MGCVASDDREERKGHRYHIENADSKKREKCPDSRWHRGRIVWALWSNSRNARDSAYASEVEGLIDSATKRQRGFEWNRWQTMYST